MPRSGGGEGSAAHGGLQAHNSLDLYSDVQDAAGGLPAHWSRACLTPTASSCLVRPLCTNSASAVHQPCNVVCSAAVAECIVPCRPCGPCFVPVRKRLCNHILRSPATLQPAQLLHREALRSCACSHLP
jgi:hypothetical protein